jgi:hypothetical protein
MEYVSEGSTSWLTVAPKDKTGAAAAPSSATWKVHDQASGDELQAETALTPGTSMEITLTPEINTLVEPTNEYEIRVVTIELIFGLDDAKTEEYQYQVDRLKYMDRTP